MRRTHTRTHAQTPLGSVHRVQHISPLVRSRWESGGGGLLYWKRLLQDFVDVRVCDTVVGRHSARRGHAVVAEMPHGDTRHSYRLQLTRSFISNAWRVIRESRLLAQVY